MYSLFQQHVKTSASMDSIPGYNQCEWSWIFRGFFVCVCLERGKVVKEDSAVPLCWNPMLIPLKLRIFLPRCIELVHAGMVGRTWTVLPGMTTRTAWTFWFSESCHVILSVCHCHKHGDNDPTWEGKFSLDELVRALELSSKFRQHVYYLGCQLQGQVQFWLIFAFSLKPESLPGAQQSFWCTQVSAVGPTCKTDWCHTCVVHVKSEEYNIGSQSNMETNFECHRVISL